MKRVIIIGAGFAGIAALKRLRRALGSGLEIALIDSKNTGDFLPLLPDCIGRRINPQFLVYETEKVCEGFKSIFINEEVNVVDLEKREVITVKRKIAYDYLLIASGSETNFYGSDNIKTNAYKIDGVGDVKMIIGAIKENNFDNYIVAGAGYTGVEVATNLRLFLKKNKRSAKVIIVESSPEILGPLPVWMKAYVAGNLKMMEIEVFTATTLEKIDGLKAYLSNSRILDNSLVIWAAGVKTVAFLQQLKVEKNPQGRVKVDEYLRLQENCFVAGDAAYVSCKGKILRMAVQFAIYEGSLAAENVANIIKGRPLKKYMPMDLGYVIPMANNYSCARVFGLNLKGRLPTLLHFLMCIYRSAGIKNKWGIVLNLMKGGG